MIYVGKKHDVAYVTENIKNRTEQLHIRHIHCTKSGLLQKFITYLECQAGMHQFENLCYTIFICPLTLPCATAFFWVIKRFSSL